MPDTLRDQKQKIAFAMMSTDDMGEALNRVMVEVEQAIREERHRADEAIDEHETQLCPEDMGCKEYMEVLRAQVAVRDAQIDAVIQALGEWSPTNQNLLDADLGAAIRDLRQAHLSERGNAEDADAALADLRETLMRWSRAGVTDDLETPMDAYGRRVLSMVLRKLPPHTPEPDSEGGK